MSFTVYKNARIFTGKEILEDSILVVSHSQKEFSAPAEGETPVKVVPALNDKLEYVGPAEGWDIPEGAEVVDMSGCTILPGLINCAARLDTLNPAPMTMLTISAHPTALSLPIVPLRRL